ncbi:MAG: ketopantoate reductase family protein [Mogibacterium sp.]|nr:ketopantoate reductase family protein [Mogibacterium sp.]
MSEGYIGLIGLGAIGAPLAELLYKYYGDRFILVSDEKHAARLKSGRIRINGNRFDPKVITPENHSGEKLDVLFICVKNYSLDSSFRDMDDLISDDTLLMPLQNGLYSYDFLRERFPENIVLEGFAQGPNTRIYDYDIVYQNPGTYYLGKSHADYKTYAVDIYELLEKAGVPCVLSEDIRHAMWCKLMLNVAGNALTALTDLDYVMFRNSPEAQKVCRTIMQEFRFVAATEDVLITAADIADVMEYFMTYRESKRTSMLEDVINKRPTENEYIAGYIKRLAEKNGVAAPFTDMLYSIMRIKEDVYLGRLQ